MRTEQVRMSGRDDFGLPMRQVTEDALDASNKWGT